MLFNSYAFVLGFLPVVVAVFIGLGRFRNTWIPTAWLILASLAFYAYWRSAYLGLLAGSVLFNYVAGLAIARYRTHSVAGVCLLTAAIGANLGLLAYFKYADFLITTLNSVFGTDFAERGIMLPLAISFFTFNQIAFLVDVHRGYVHDYGFLDYALFIIFFPHLIAGPIVHHRDIIPQFRNFNFSYANPLFGVGLAVFSIGLFKKVILADHVAPYADAVFDSAATSVVLTPAESWLGAIAYTLQLYFDFSGYSDMAVGGALLFGIRFPWNFDAPYKAASIIDFWRRWHISLSLFLREYLYIPLGGNRAGGFRRSTNILVTMLLGGLWHGANWTFVLWGGVHGLYVIINHAWRDWRASQAWLPAQPSAGERIVAHGLTFGAVVAAWVLFRSETLDVAVRVYLSMLGIGTDGAWTLDTLALFPHLPAELQGSQAFLWVGSLLAICWLTPSLRELTRGLLDPPPAARARPGISLSPSWAIATGTLAWLAILFLARPTEFLYYQF